MQNEQFCLPLASMQLSPEPVEEFGVKIRWIVVVFILLNIIKRLKRLKTISFTVINLY